MFNIKSFKYNNCNKKGLMALDFLIGIILSTLALFALIAFFGDKFFVMPENEKIAQDNMNSIMDFFDIIDEKYSGNYKNCFANFKLTNLENFQFSENNLDDNYFYLLSIENNQSYIYIFKLNRYENLLEEFDNKNFDLSNWEYKEKIDINNFLFDETDGGSIIGYLIDEFNPVPFFDYIYSLGQADKKLKLVNNKVKYFILVPKLLDNSNFVSSKGKKLFFEEYSQNILKPVIILNDGDKEEYEPRKLVYRPRDKSIFIPNSDLTNLLIDTDLCSNEDVLNLHTLSFYNKKENGKFSNIDKFDFMNNEILIDVNVESPKCSQRFSWKRKPICKENNKEIDCNLIFSNLSKNIDFENFFNLVSNYYINNNECYGIDNKLKFKLDPKSLNYDYLSNNLYNIKFKEVFDLYADENGNSININLLDDKEKDKYVFDFAAWGGGDNYEFNGPEEEFSNLVAFVNNKIYFYLSGDETNAKYYSFRQNLLKKIYNEDIEENDLYFNGKKVNNGEKPTISADLEKFSWFGGDDKNLRWFKINVEGKEYDILISPQQFYNIQSMEG